MAKEIREFSDRNGTGIIPNKQIGETYITTTNESPSSLFGGTWELVRTFYGGELIAFGNITSSGANKTFNQDATIEFSNGNVTNRNPYYKSYIDDVLSTKNGTFLVKTKGIVGFVDCHITWSGSGSCTGFWWRGGQTTFPLPDGVTMTYSGSMTGRIGGTYGGSSNYYQYYVENDPTDGEFYVNPSAVVYGGNFNLGAGGVTSIISVKVYAKNGASYLWKKISD